MISKWIDCLVEDFLRIFAALNTEEYELFQYVPAEHKNRHQNAMRHFDDQDCGDRLECKLADRCDRSHKGVLISMKTSVLLKAKDRAIAQNRLIQYLEEVHPYQDRKDDFVCLAANALVLKMALDKH
jgi:hypothetical protein